MRITMIKKRLASGEPCKKCQQIEDMLVRRGLWHRIDEVVWAVEDDPGSAGMALARAHGVASAPFFVVTEASGREAVYESALALIRERLSDAGAAAHHAGTAGHDAGAAAHDDSAHEDGDIDIAALARELDEAEPAAIVRWALERFGRACALAFSGAEDVALIDMAARSGLSFSVFCLDTGRLHPETYEFVDRVRAHYGIEIALLSPSPERLEPLVREKGLFSFYRDGHQECCAVRKVEPLERALAAHRAWMTGQRRDQSPDTRAQVPVIQRDPRFLGAAGPLVKLNPLARWSSAETWGYIRAHDVPYNPLHERGYVSIGCAPCTRAVLPGQHEREGRWWWELATARECGLHAAGKPGA